MDLFSILTLIGGLALFLYGMNAMGDGLAKVSGYDCYGGRFCKFRDHEIITGSRRDHGCQYRYYDHLLDLKSDRNTE